MFFLVAASRKDKLFLIWIGLMACVLAYALAKASPETPPEGTKPFPVVYAEVDGSISPAQVDLLEDSLAECEQQKAKMLLLRLDTPGGLGDSMRKMVRLILNSKVPVVVWVGPSGARAASAGVFIVAASAVAAMSPQSTIGAASPVGLGGRNVDKTMAEKIKNDILSLIRGTAAARDRNVSWYVEAVERSVSITASEAVMLQVVELMAQDPRDLLSQIGTRGLKWKGEVLRFQADDVKWIEFKPGVRHSILSWLLDPQVAYLLLLGGMAGLFFELTTPGAILPGVLGGMCLLLGLYALSILPTNAAGLLLILFGLVLFILELKITSYGLLSIAGLVCFFIGSTILFRFEYGMAGLPLSTIIGTGLVLAAIIGTGVYLVAKAHSRKPSLGLETLIGAKAEVRAWEGQGGQVFVRGEIWSARTASPHAFKPRDKVLIIAVHGLLLTVEPESK
ncbi:MAG: NfeD family protein [Thermodesulfobacteriota bacterium]|nr:NfeD family protein [Thermodesulfobacteriota bacterium]